MDESFLLIGIAAAIVSCVGAVVIGYFVWQSQQQPTTTSGNLSTDTKNTNNAPPSNQGTPSYKGKCSGPWKDGGAMSWYDVFDPVDGSGSVAELYKPNKKFFDEVNVVSVHSEDWAHDKYKNIDVFVSHDGWNGPGFSLIASDYCSDKDCAGDEKGCCTRNKKQFSKTTGYLLDVEQRTAARALGSQWPKFKDIGVLKVKYRLCPSSVTKASLTKKYKN